MKKSLLGLAVAASLCASFSASAEDMYRGAWYAVPGVNFIWTDKAVKADDGKVGATLAIGKELSPSWDLQGRISYDDVDSVTNKFGVNGKYKTGTWSLDALYMLSRDQFRPFLLAGVGIASNKLDYNPGFTEKQKTSLMGNLGAGFQYLFTDKFGIQADARAQWTKAQATNGVFKVDDTITNGIVNLGGIFRFGEPAPVVAAAAPEPAPMPVVEPTPEPAPAPVVCSPTTETITLSSEKLFAFNQAGLRDTSDIDSQVIAKMQENPIFASVKIVGHTDKIGSDAYNQKLSVKRANEVRDYIISKGIQADRLVAVGMGESKPKVSCDGIKGRKALIECLAPNRRVEIEATRSVETGCN